MDRHGRSRELLAAVALGSNVGDRAHALDRAVIGLCALPATRVLAVSSYHETAPVGPVPQGPYLNAAATLETGLSGRALLEMLQAIERELGRDRSREQRWGPRTLDLDLLLFGDAVIEEAGLVVPHPRMHERRFVLAPLAEIAPEWVVPTRHATVAELLASLPAASG